MLMMTISDVDILAVHLFTLKHSTDGINVYGSRSGSVSPTVV